MELLQRHVLHLTERLEVAESKLAALEECECSVGCPGEVEGEPDRGHLDVWQEDCQACSCNSGKVIIMIITIITMTMVAVMMMMY